MKAPPVIKIKYENSGLAGSNTKKTQLKAVLFFTTATFIGA